jgi:hypothetical protein
MRLLALLHPQHILSLGQIPHKILLNPSACHAVHRYLPLLALSSNYRYHDSETDSLLSRDCISATVGSGLVGFNVLCICRDVSDESYVNLNQDQTEMFHLCLLLCAIKRHTSADRYPVPAVTHHPLSPWPFLLPAHRIYLPCL